MNHTLSFLLSLPSENRLRFGKIKKNILLLLLTCTIFAAII